MLFTDFNKKLLGLHHGIAQEFKVKCGEIDAGQEVIQNQEATILYKFQECKKHRIGMGCIAT